MRLSGRPSLHAAFALCVEVLGLVLIVAAAVESGGRWPLHQGPLDFAIYYHSAGALAAGGSPFTQGALDPPTFSLILQPLTPFGLPTAYAIFTVASAAVMAIGLWLGATRLGLRGPAVVVAVAGLLWYPVLHGLVLGQPVPIVVGLLLVVLFLVSTERLAWGGLLASLLWIKPDMTTPVIIVMALAIGVFLSRSWRFIVPFVGGSAAFFAVQASRFVPWLHLLATSTQTTVSRPSQISITAAVGLLQNSAAAGQLQWMLTATKVLVLACAVVGLLGLFVWLLPRTAGWLRLPGWERLWWSAGITATVWMIASPYTQLYDEAFVLPLILVAVRHDAAQVRTLAQSAIVLLAALPLLTVLAAPATFLIPVANLALLAWTWQELATVDAQPAEARRASGKVRALTS